MTRVVLGGLNGASPLGFLGALGLLRRLQDGQSRARLGFLADGSFRPYLEGVDADLAAFVAHDAERASEETTWQLRYEKTEKRSVKIVADLKPPPSVFARFLDACLERWTAGDGSAVAYAAAFATSVAVDGKGNTKPTAFHFTAANQTFLGAIELIRAAVTAEWAARSLFDGNAARPGSNVRWDSSAERNRALMATNPEDDKTRVDAPLEWLAFRALPLFPCYPSGSRVLTTAVEGRGDDMKLTWPLWSPPASLATVRSALQVPWTGAARDRAARGVFAICTSAIRRTSQGFGNFGPATVTS
jgi:hypothetical protein